MRLVLVEWLDSMGVGGDWQCLDCVKDPEPVVCVSVGWIIRDTEEYILIASHRHDGGVIDDAEAQVCGTMAITKGTVVKIADLSANA